MAGSSRFFVVVLAGWGIKSIDDAGKKIVESARQRVEPVIQSTEDRAKAAQLQITKSADKVSELNKLIDAETKAVSTLESKLATAQTKLSAYELKMQEYEARVSKSGTEVLTQTESLRKSSATALSEIGNYSRSGSKMRWVKCLSEMKIIVGIWQVYYVRFC